MLFRSVVLAATAAQMDELLPALAAAAGTFFDATRIPLFIVFYAGLAIVLWEAVVIRELRNLIMQASQTTMRITGPAPFASPST